MAQLRTTLVYLLPLRQGIKSLQGREDVSMLLIPASVHFFDKMWDTVLPQPQNQIDDRAGDRGDTYRQTVPTLPSILAIRTIAWPITLPVHLP